jgi:hypothetical protein
MERVGVRGLFDRHRLADKLRLAERPPHPARKSAPTSPRERGEVKAAAKCDCPGYRDGLEKYIHRNPL